MTPLLLGDSEVHLWRLPLGVTTENETSHITGEEQRQAEQYPNGSEGGGLPVDMMQEQYLTYCIARRRILASYSERDVLISRTPSGKPYLVVADANEDLVTFSASHTSMLACIAVARRRAVGVDVELLDPSVDYTSAARLFLSQREQRWMMAHTSEQVPHAFLRVWTFKEAVRKCLDLGEQQLAWPDFTVEPVFLRSGSCLWQCASDYQSAVSCSLLEVALDPGYVTALAVATDARTTSALTVTLHDLSSLGEEKEKEYE